MAASRVGSQAKTIWRYQGVNTLTGEVIDLAPGNPTRLRWKEHVQLFQQAMQCLAEEGKLKAQGWRVLGYLLGQLDWDNWVVVPQRQIAAALRMSQPNVSRSIHDLLALHILVQA